jgi:hypothetical protein
MLRRSLTQYGGTFAENKYKYKLKVAPDTYQGFNYVK